MKPIITPLLLTALTLTAASHAQTTPSQAAYHPTPAITRSLVYNPGDDSSKYYRIPAITTLPDGTLITVADKRYDTMADLPAHIDIVCRRSTDGGLTWSPYITIVADDGAGGFGDPALVRDRRTGDLIVICTHGQGLWQKTPGRISVIRSSDGGLTWSRPTDINPQILTCDPNGHQPIKCNSAFASSGAALQTSRGRIIFALVTRREGVQNFPVYAIYSDNGGRTWHASRTPATLNGDESKITELPNGTLLMSIRNRWGGPRRFAISTDQGITWREDPTRNQLHDVACNGDILSIKHQGKNLLLQSLPDGPWRSNITIYPSADGGHTWGTGYRVSPGPGAYSAMTQLPDGSIAILTEEGTADCGANHSGGYRIWCTRIPLDLIVGK